MVKRSHLAAYYNVCIPASYPEVLVVGKQQMLKEVLEGVLKGEHESLVQHLEQ